MGLGTEWQELGFIPPGAGLFYEFRSLETW